MDELSAEPPRADPCNPSPCGSNAQCSNGICTCLPEYHGDPYIGCRPECVLSTDCSKDKACVRNKCIDPCPGTCGQNANCVVINHIPTCTCNEGFIGNAFISCRPIPSNTFCCHTISHIFIFKLVPEISDPCNPSPCGPNSLCRTINNQAVCTCIVGYIGSPPTCRPECIVSSDCPLNLACSNQKCIDPCPGTCGISAICQVVNHNPVCSCPPRYTGDPFTRCIIIRKSDWLIDAEQILFNNNFRRTSTTSNEPVPTFTLRSKLAMQSTKRLSILHVSS